MTHTKVCTSCNMKLAFSAFYSKEKTKDGLVGSCKACNRKVQSEQKKIKKKAIFNYKGGECKRCGIVDHPSFYDLHHRDPSTKKFSIGASYTIKESRMKEEADKCDMLCPNCHRRAHMRMRNDLIKDKTT